MFINPSDESNHERHNDPARTSLAGVAFSSFATALTSFLMLSSQSELRRAIVWLFGGEALSG